MSHSQALIAELDAALGPEPGVRSANILRGVTDLYLSGEGAYAPEQVSVFDDVLLRLADMVDAGALAELSERLAALDVAPPKTLMRLLHDANAAVSGPVLAQSRALPEKELLALVKAGSEPVLMLIVRREHVTKAVTDAVSERNIGRLTRAILENPGAEISDTLFVKLISEAAGDPALAQSIASRSDLPEELRPFLDAYLPKPPEAAEPQAG
jgi:uncharacterized protein (DUF2336 family)